MIIKKEVMNLKEKSCSIINIDEFFESSQKLRCFKIYDIDRRNGVTDIIEIPAINDYLFLMTIKKSGLYLCKQIVVTKDAFWLRDKLINEVIINFEDFVDLMEKRNYIIDGFNDLYKRILEIASFPLAERVTVEHYDRLIALNYNVRLTNKLDHIWKHNYLMRGYVNVVKAARALVEAKENEASSEKIYMLNKKLAISYMFFLAKNRMPIYEYKGYNYNMLMSNDNLFKLFS